ncbi:alpha/beta hydrolase [Spirillospora sp. NPDC048819]|uniref:alpha/beta hydrolase family protein n=1 Tax=Spirillospora sp. NPDC048819 TaxID=3155268 RepID=UPI0033DA3515
MSGIVREFVGLPSPLTGRAGAGGHPCQGVYHRPAGNPPRTAFIATHYNVDFSEHYLAEHLATRGYGFLGWNTRFRGNEAHFLLDHALAEIGTGVRWLREHAGAERIVLLGNSGGGSLMAAYQSQAVEPNVTPVAGMRPVSAIEDLPAGDLFIALAAHSGRPEVLTAWMDPSVTDETDPLSADPALDPFNPENGPPYDALRTWLSMWSLRTSQCAAAPHLARITAPSLVVHATADECVYDSDARAVFDALASSDKTLDFIKDTHYLPRSRAWVADLMDAWVRDH